ncbi:hypothetical protein [Clostridium sp. E02]|uniref:hypothetical protein n=1 Tax=Clostridium sp. E02 TaxID=2487134 RepID=UPI000F53737E|nr:hypothetical protein [Clostridium sp. E02]
MLWKRILAYVGVLILLGMYLIALISAFMKSPESNNWLMAAIFCTVIIPVILYASQLVIRVLKRDQKDNASEEK